MKIYLTIVPLPHLEAVLQAAAMMLCRFQFFFFFFSMRSYSGNEPFLHGKQARSIGFLAGLRDQLSQRLIVTHILGDGAMKPFTAVIYKCS